MWKPQLVVSKLEWSTNPWLEMKTMYCWTVLYWAHYIQTVVLLNMLNGGFGFYFIFQSQPSKTNNANIQENLLHIQCIAYPVMIWWNGCHTCLCIWHAMLSLYDELTYHNTYLCMMDWIFKHSCIIRRTK